MSDYSDTTEDGEVINVKEEKPAKRKPFAPGQVFGTSKEKEAVGTWVNVAEGAKIKIRRVNYSAAKEHMRKLMRPHEQAVKMKRFTDDDERPILIKILVEHLVVSWSGFYEPVFNKDGSPVLDSDGDQTYSETPYSKQAALKLFTETPDFLKTVWGLCEDAENFKSSAEEEDAKN